MSDRLVSKLPATTLVFAWVVALNASANDLADDDRKFFADKVAPILQANCLGCHSHAAGEMAGGLTLDSASGWQVGGDSGPAIIPGDPDGSLLIRAIRRDGELQMPPDDRLSAESIATLSQWVRRGAHDPRAAPAHGHAEPQIDPRDWWSLRPLVRPEVPENGHQNPIDALIAQQLTEHGLAFSPPADRRALIRRVMFDLHGLPPDPQQVQTFVNDSDPLAYAKLVDRLLESPRYGERWARHWLDTVHFADSHGCEHDVFRPHAWRYRDYVIDRFNRDIDWATFIREQLAADHFFPERSDLIPALGFIAAGPLELSRAGTAPVTFDYLDRDDMVTQTMAAFASTTANCARCHDHKFDPVSQEDYYSLQAVFAGIGKGDVAFDTEPAIAAARKRWSELVERAKAGTVASLLNDDLRGRIRDWEGQIKSRSIEWHALRPDVFVSAGGATLKRLEDDSLSTEGERPETDIYTVTAIAPLVRMSALRLQVLSDDSLPAKGPGRADNGNFHLSEIEVSVFLPGADRAKRLDFRQAAADWNQQDWTIQHAIDQQPQTAWGIFPQVGQSHTAVFEFAEAIELPPGSRIVVLLKQTHGGVHTIGRPKLSVTDGQDACQVILPQEIAQAIDTPASERTGAQVDLINRHALLEIAQNELARLPQQELVYAVSNRYSHAKKLEQPISPKVVHVLKRGDIHRPGEVAVPGALAVIDELSPTFQQSDLDDEPARRAALANWLAAPENPLTWRSIVNRVWGYHFGKGLCDTPNDFGRMGGLPSHPQLLDWLAVWFRDQAGGSIKQLHRLILSSHTYQQSCRTVNDRAAELDRGNRMLWRMNRRRLDAESYRDAVLQISGRIDLSVGGPGIQQFVQSQGPQTTPHLDYEAFDWSDSRAARRSIYRVVWRGIADPFMEALDFPDLGLLAPKREFSVSALQALALYNNDFTLHHCAVVAERLQEIDATIEGQVDQAVQRILLRTPAADERRALVEYATEFGLAALVRVLLNSNEFLFID